MAAPSSSGARPTRRAFLAALAAGGAGLSAAAYARYAEPTWFELAEVPLDRALFPAPAGLRILHLSDLHLGPHVSLGHIEHAVELGLAQRPDLVALTGDYITGRLREAAAYAAVLRRLSAAAPTFACLGNHDAIVAEGPIGEVARTAAVMGLLRAAQADVLVNETREVAVRGGRLKVSGLGDLWTKQNHPARCLTPRRGPGREPLAHLLLNHNPDARIATMPYHWDLMLCGHTHGGQVGVPGLAEWLAPVSDKSHLEGLREREGRLIHITRGIGNLYGVRFWCRPQVEPARRRLGLRVEAHRQRTTVGVEALHAGERVDHGGRLAQRGRVVAHQAGPAEEVGDAQAAEETAGPAGRQGVARARGEVAQHRRGLMPEQQGAGGGDAGRKGVELGLRDHQLEVLRGDQVRDLGGLLDAVDDDGADHAVQGEADLVAVREAARLRAGLGRGSARRVRRSRRRGRVSPCPSRARPGRRGRPRPTPAWPCGRR
jgi:predicted MPP superfamily phosphohydrolase